MVVITCWCYTFSPETQNFRQPVANLIPMFLNLRRTTITVLKSTKVHLNNISFKTSQSYLIFFWWDQLNECKLQFWYKLFFVFDICFPFSKHISHWTLLRSFSSNIQFWVLCTL